MTAVDAGTNAPEPEIELVPRDGARPRRRRTYVGAALVAAGGLVAVGIVAVASPGGPRGGLRAVAPTFARASAPTASSPVVDAVLGGLSVFDVPADLTKGTGICNYATPEVQCWGGVVNGVAATADALRRFGTSQTSLTVSVAPTVENGIRGGAGVTDSTVDGTDVSVSDDGFFRIETFTVRGSSVTVRGGNVPAASVDAVVADIISRN